MIFRLNRNRKDTKGIFKQYKPPFIVTNTLRVSFFAIFTLVAFQWATDIVDPIDPFKIYKPTVVALFGGVFIAVILIASLFIYRPWCRLFCPFGAISGLISFSLVRYIRTDECTDCGLCERICPSHAADRDDKKTECYYCNRCVEICPHNAIKYANPPSRFRKFNPKKNEKMTMKGTD